MCVCMWGGDVYFLSVIISMYDFVEPLSRRARRVCARFACNVCRIRNSRINKIFEIDKTRPETVQKLTDPKENVQYSFVRRCAPDQISGRLLLFSNFARFASKIFSFPSHVKERDVPIPFPVYTRSQSTGDVYQTFQSCEN